MLEFSEEELGSVIAGGDEGKVRDSALSFAYTNADQRVATLRIARLLLYPLGDQDEIQSMHNKTNTAYEQWMEQLQNMGDNRSRYLCIWLSRPSRRMHYPIFLYNKDFGASRVIFEKMLTAEKAAPPYVDLIWLNLFRQGLGLSHDKISELYDGPLSAIVPYFHELFQTSSVVDEWLAKKKQPLRFYSGATNTIAGLYDHIFRDEETGSHLISRHAECYFDLGGGFCTSEISRLVGREFTSADIIHPSLRENDPELVLMRAKKNKPSVIGADEREKYLRAQDQVPYLPFDVLQNSFPDDANSYVITSTGFMTSTVRPSKRKRSLRTAKKSLPSVSLSVHAIARVLELVAKGKDVDLFTIQRATVRLYKYKTCLLQWRKGQLVTLTTTDDKRRGSDEWLTWRDEVYSLIDPRNPEFSAVFDNQ